MHAKTPVRETTPLIQFYTDKRESSYRRGGSHRCKSGLSLSRGLRHAVERRYSTASDRRPIAPRLVADGDLYIPAGLIGTLVGFACFHRITNRQFQFAVNVLFVASGAVLLV
jgi:hypothetical protein